MKKLLILLLFIPLVSFGQVNSYTDLQKINSLEQFKRIAIENGYEKSKYQNDVNIVEYYLNPSFNDEELTNADGAAFYYIDNKDFRFVFKENFLGVNIEYDDIYDSVKKDCRFFEIIPRKNLEFATYSCVLKGKLGFVEEEGFRYIHYFAER
tara:strand:- start:58 stop:513 length:456 start_codon:yes stop_codon:yes gene_type:complete